ncbi:phosphate ABC transporter permease subunit PstC [Lacticigenium naphthae]|uniref:phosphate ABC transporter permease subunit PstC n=1 Tax=Lacticigenium naphthae TaxID=515351 RepID=UPI0003FD6045|nr:phosphate ABC transporter permease subunit PstC [Lacticigenium naphthae]
MEETVQHFKKRSPKRKQERFGKTISLVATIFIVSIVFSILFFVASRGLRTFTEHGVSAIDFFAGTAWRPGEVSDAGEPLVGAFPMIAGSFLVTIFSALLATPFALGAAIFMTEISPKTGKKYLQPVIELLVGIPSVVYGFIGLTVIVPFIRQIFGGTGFGVLAATLVLFVMILPTTTSMAVDTLNAVPRYYREASFAMGATRWQTIYKVVLRAASPGLLTAVIFGMARAFGEALAVQMVIGNAALVPDSLTTPASTLTSILTMNMGNTVLGTLENDVLWSLATILLFMSLFFNILTRWIGKKGAMK